MNIYAYHLDGKWLKLDGICEDWFEILWTRRFFKGDDFTITVPPTETNIKRFAEGQIVELVDPDNICDISEYAGIITSVKVVSGDNSKITIKGKSFDGMLERRILLSWLITGGDTIMTVLRRNAGDLTAEPRRFVGTHFVSDTDNDPIAPSLAQFQFKKLSDYVLAVGQQLNWGLQSAIRHNYYDADTDSILPPHIIITGRYSVDRSVNQDVNKHVVFSDEYENATNFERNYNEGGAVTAVVVGSPQAYDDGTRKEIDRFVAHFDKGATSYERIEKYQKITPVTSAEYRGEETWAVLDYDKTYAQAEQLAKNAYIEPTDYFGCTILLGNGWSKKVKLGDIVTAQNTRWNMSADKMLTEVQEYYGADSKRITATLGEAPKTLLEIISSKQNER